MTEDPNAKLATRDPNAMAQQPKDADYAGAEPDEQLGTGESDLLVAGAGMSVNSPAGAMVTREQDRDPNPGYTPPSKMVPPHPTDGAADLQEGSPLESELEHGPGRSDHP
ncbi:hypothetical protein [Deinococcus sonorensis]|uniref:Uncharacterized protein n=2 Tax=Deinococcus sonorensis TaxID=309891 RepID=A0AAU7U837_9DEIO